jgi:four helix bundle protein
MGAMRFTDLRVWQAAVDLCVDLYALTAGLLPLEEYGLKAQIRRAAVSIGSTIAEGFGRYVRASARCRLRDAVQS